MNPPLDDNAATPRRKRPTRAAVQQMLAGGMPAREPVFTEDVDGNPGHAGYEHLGPMSSPMSLSSLSWTEEEWDDPTITE